MGEGPVTIYDVAAEAGVSPSTVSRVFSRPGRVSSATARRVREVADGLGYRSQAVYRAATPVRTRTIGLIVTDITNPFFSPIIKGAARAAVEADRTLVMVDSAEDERTERETLARIATTVDGLVVASSRVSDTTLRTLAKQLPVVVLNRWVQGIPSVLPDTGRGVRRAVEHLTGLGHHAITYVAGPAASYADGARWRALREACLELDLTPHHLGPFAPTAAGGAEAAAAAGRQPPSALLVYNDLMAIGLLRALQRSGVAVPGDVSVVSFDNIFGSDLVTPALTTVAAPLGRLGEIGVRDAIALSGVADGTHRPPVTVPVRLLVRESTGPARPVQARRR